MNLVILLFKSYLVLRDRFFATNAEMRGGRVAWVHLGSEITEDYTDCADSDNIPFLMTLSCKHRNLFLSLRESDSCVVSV